MKKILTILSISILTSLSTLGAVFADDGPPSLSISFGSTEESSTEEPESSEPPSLEVTLGSADSTEVVTVEESEDVTEEIEEVTETVVVVDTPQSTSETGPGILIYAALPVLGLMYGRKRK